MRNFQGLIRASALNGFIQILGGYECGLMTSGKLSMKFGLVSPHDHKCYYPPVGVTMGAVYLLVTPIRTVFIVKKKNRMLNFQHVP